MLNCIGALLLVNGVTFQQFWMRPPHVDRVLESEAAYGARALWSYASHTPAMCHRSCALLHVILVATVYMPLTHMSSGSLVRNLIQILNLYILSRQTSIIALLM